MNKDNISDILVYLVAAIITAGIIVLIGYALSCSWSIHQVKEETPPETKRGGSLILIEGNSLKAATPPCMIKPQVLGMLGYGLEVEEAELLNRIIECESGWENVPNAKYGREGGQGVAQLIPSTVKLCEEALNKTLDPFNEQDALECAVYLLTETEAGKYHWGTPDSWWGSYWCWANN